MIDPITALCPNCGLCCDGTLFADVELRPSDQPARLARLGLSLHKKSKSKLAFPQPCSCFDGQLCRIYDDRPKRCRAFACGLLKKTEAGEITAAVALKKISRAKEQIDQTNALLKSLRAQDESVALLDRYTEAMSAPIDMADPSAAKKRGQLMRGYDRLMKFFLRDFLS